MKTNNFIRNRITLPLLLAMFAFSSCVKDVTYKTFTMYRAEYSIKPEVKENIRLKGAEPLKDLGSFVLYDNTMYINERDKGIHVIDYSNPVQPVNRGFIPIPGNKGIAIRNNHLYADCYCDLFVLKINSRENIVLDNVVSGVFKGTMNSRTNFNEFVDIKWIGKDTTVTVEIYNQYHLYDSRGVGVNTFQFAPGSSPTSVGSSMAVFTIVGDYLYTVDNSNLYAFSIAENLKPVLKKGQHVGFDVETIFPFEDKLFLGSMTGMYIYGLQDPASPKQISRFGHVRVCDPVIADSKFAFVTLRDGSQCGGYTNQLDVLNISDVQNPVLARSYNFTNPHGLSKDGNVLFICDGNDGLRVLNAEDPANMVERMHLQPGKALDVIAYKQLAFVTLDDAVKIYTYDQQFNVQPLGTINKD